VALAGDGSKLAFDFVVHLPDGYVTTYMVGIYDIATQTVDILRAPSPNEYHSPSFSPDDQQLVMIQFCWSPDCAAEDLGHQIALADLRGLAVTRITDGRTKVPILMDCYGCGSPVEPDFVVRALPLFTADGEAIVYGGRNRTPDLPGKLPAHVDVAPVESHALLPMRLDLASGEERPFVDFQSTLRFQFLYRWTRFGERYLVTGTNPRAPADSDRLPASLKDSRYLFTLTAEDELLAFLPEVSPVPFLPWFQQGPVAAVRPDRFYPPGGADSSSDGQRVVFVEEANDAATDELLRVLYLVERGAVNAIHLLDRTGPTPAAAMSGDGRWVSVVLTSEGGAMLLFDLQDKTLRQLPLRQHLMARLESMALKIAVQE